MEIKNVSGVTRELIDGTIVEPDATFEAVGDDAKSYLEQPANWARADKPKVTVSSGGARITSAEARRLGQEPHDTSS